MAPHHLENLPSPSLACSLQPEYITEFVYQQLVEGGKVRHVTRVRLSDWTRAKHYNYNTRHKPIWLLSCQSPPRKLGRTAPKPIVSAKIQ
ncbi:hypothetical protein AVEN_136983-1 [Araneus ventricosus]|uniref:Uncharacterized protein n=1 Tax=Araneus ventricosus TaxID=182803 RepID=A0A4Y2VN90_ARAVE|nr:hypothetical protein AVEN_136983-1 [Araneus ventricosus]